MSSAAARAHVRDDGPDGIALVYGGDQYVAICEDDEYLSALRAGKMAKGRKTRCALSPL